MLVIKNFFQKFIDRFPTVPSIKLDTAFGIDISDGSIEVLELRWFGKYRVVAHGRVELKKGIIEDGKILKEEDLKRKVAEALASAKPRKISTNRVILSLPESKVFIHYFKVPASVGQGKDKNTLAQVVVETARKIIPFDENSMYYDWQMTPATNKVLFVSAPKDIVDAYVKLLSELGLVLIALDIESSSLGRALLKKKQYPQMVIDIGSRTSNLSIFDADGLLNLSVSISIAGREFTRLIAKKLKISEDEAETLKKDIGLKKGSDMNILEILKPGLEVIVQGIKKAVAYYEHNYFQKLETLILAGGSALLPNLDEYLSAQTNLKVSVGDALKKIVWKKSLIGKTTVVLFANVIGLAMRGASGRFKSINLLEHVPREKFEVSRKLDLLTLGHLRKTTIIRSIVTSNPILVIIISLFIFFSSGVIMYYNVFKPFRQQYLLTTVELPAIGVSKPVSIPEIDALVPETEYLEFVIIQDTPTGWLNVRTGPDISYPRVSRIYPEETYTFLEEENKWYKIKIDDETEGWIISRYATKE